MAESEARKLYELTVCLLLYLTAAQIYTLDSNFRMNTIILALRYVKKQSIRFRFSVSNLFSILEKNCVIHFLILDH